MSDEPIRRMPPNFYDRTPPLASQTPEGKERLRAYYEALGRFVDMFSKAERAVHLVLRNYAKMTDGAARALLSGVRVDETRNRLSRLHEAKAMSDEDWVSVEPILQHLNEINGCRNEILHHGALTVAEGDGLVTNAAMALTVDRVTGFPISPDILADMTFDLRKIILHLYVRHLGRPPLRGDHPELQATLHAPWRYTRKPEPLAAKGKSARPDQPTKQSHPTQPKRRRK